MLEDIFFSGWGSIARTAISTVTTELGGSNAAHKAK
jgi:hypothetical protein